jgi:hypothetical protein
VKSQQFLCPGRGRIGASSHSGAVTHKPNPTLTLLLLLAPLGCNEPELELSDEIETPDIVHPDIEVELAEGSDWLADVTARELIDAPDGYLEMAPIQQEGEAGCNASGAVSVRVAEGVDVDAKVTTLCADELPGGEIVLRACEDHELSLGEMSMSSVTADNEPVGNCYWCESYSCFPSKAPQRKEGNIAPCFPNFWENCCWAINSGCC